MIRIRKAQERGHADHGWLDTWHSFSFADYYDPKHMGYRALRVINEDFVAPSEGFPMHPHRDMEIVTVVLEGALEHKDSMGNGTVIRPGEVQRMSAGTGVFHSEFNHSDSERVHLLQIWILPRSKGSRPSYEQKEYGVPSKLNRLCLVASSDGREGSVTIDQDVSLYVSRLEKGRKLSLDLAPGRYAWIQVTRGELLLNGHSLQAGDGAAVSEEKALEFVAGAESEFLAFDLN